VAKKQVNLNRPFHAESLWVGLGLAEDSYYGLTYDEARYQWRIAQAPSVIEGLAAEYRKLRQLGTPHDAIDEACYDGYLEYQRRWPKKSREMRSAVKEADELNQIDEPDAVSDRLNQVQPNDEVDKGNEAIQPLPDELPDRNDDSIIAANLIGELVAGMP
jgi:hypothetical protein